MAVHAGIRRAMTGDLARLRIMLVMLTTSALALGTASKWPKRGRGRSVKTVRRVLIEDSARRLSGVRT